MDRKKNKTTGLIIIDYYFFLSTQLKIFNFISSIHPINNLIKMYNVFNIITSIYNHFYFISCESFFYIFPNSFEG